MSKKSKKANKAKNLIKKRAIKTANKARFQRLRELGENSKSKRSRLQSKFNKRAKPRTHMEGYCGNVACKVCFIHSEKGMKRVA